MNSSHHLLGLDDAAAGMVLACDLRDGGGGVLLPAGAVLSAASLQSLRRRGIGQVDVFDQDLGASTDDEAAAGAAARHAAREFACARLARLFRRSSDSGASAELLDRLYLYRCTR